MVKIICEIKILKVDSQDKKFLFSEDKIYKMLSVGLALSAGFCAAIASLCAKLAFSPEIVFKDVCESVDFWIVECSGHCDKVSNEFCLCFYIFLNLLKVFVCNCRLENMPKYGCLSYVSITSKVHPPPWVLTWQGNLKYYTHTGKTHIF